MASITYDVTGVEVKGDRPVPKPGVYTLKIVSCIDAKPSGKDRRLEMQYDIVGGEFEGARIYDYVNLEAETQAWRLAMLVQALELPAKGKLDPNKITGKTVTGRTRIDPGNEQYAPSAKIASLLPPSDDAEPDESDEDAEPDADEDDEVWTAEELGELTLDELKEQCSEYELDAAALLKGKKTAATKKKALIDAIIEAQGGDEDEDAEDAEDEDEDGEEETEDETDEGDGDEEEDELWSQEELEALNSKELKEVAGEFDGVKVPAKFTSAAKAKLIEAILAAQGGDDEDEESDEAPDYSAMDLSELKADLKKRGLSTKGTKVVLVKRLEKDDEPV